MPEQSRPSLDTAATTGEFGGPHPGTLEIYEVAPAGQTSEDPAVAYDQVSFEPIINVYQTLVAYNGSSTAQFVPEVSTCVPGLSDGSQSTPSVSCQAVYGNSLIVNGPSGAPEYFTYPIDPHAHFYDGATGVSWPVYPSDVMFSLARTMGFADLPGAGVLNGWIQAQSLLPIGNVSWDSHLHYPFNSTPQNILGSMLINDSRYCPASALGMSGCVTFNASGSSQPWPFFSQLVATALGAGIVPCGWFTAQAAGVPGFPGSAAANGDGPCLLPGGATNTSQAAFESFLAKESPTAWDTFEQLALNHPAVQPKVQYNLVGSGPYYIAPGDDLPTEGYTLQANPAYEQPAGCVGVGGGCEPAAGAFQSKVVVRYEPGDVEGIQQYIAGQADAAAILTSDTATMVQLASEGKLAVISSPTLAITALAYNLDFNMTGAMAVGTDYGNLNVASDFFASNTVREFLDHAWPYTTVNETLWTTDGFSYGFNFGGAIPRGMGEYYPTNISWPYLGGNPDDNTSVNSATWWWTEGTTPGNPYYDPELAACSPSVPCKFPVIDLWLDSSVDHAISDFIASVKTITQGAVQPFTFVEWSWGLGGPCGGPVGPGYNWCLPFYDLGWIADYPDPTDYLSSLYYANSTYTLDDQVYQVLESNSTYNSSSCGHTGNSWADLAYWANYFSEMGQPIPNDCQGPAYHSMLVWMNTATSLPIGSYRVLVYNEVESIENQLGLYLWLEETNYVETCSKWIDTATVNTNPMVGGGGVQTWYLWQYSSFVTNVTFHETGLASGITWSVSYAGLEYSSSASNLTVPYQTNGSYSYEVGYQNGYTITAGAANGTIVVAAPTAVTVNVTFTSFTGGSTLNFQEIGLESGASWTVVVTGVGAITGNASLVRYTVPTSGSPYSYVVGTQVGYTASPVKGTAATGTTTTIVFTGVLASTFPVTIVPFGLQGASWTATVGGYTNSSTGSLVFWEPNGSYEIVATSNTTLSPVFQANPVFVNGVGVTVFVSWVREVSPETYVVTFTASQGFAEAWSVSFNGLTNSSSTGGTIGFTAVNGTYTFAVTVPSGYAASPSGGPVSVRGSTTSVAIAVSVLTAPATKYSNSTGVPIWAYAVIGGLLALTLVFLASTVFFNRQLNELKRKQGSGAGGDSPSEDSRTPPPPP